MNIFIDCGAYNGDTIEEFKNWSKIAFPSRDTWQLYAFEPNPRFKEYWDSQTHENLNFSNAAVWTQDTDLPFAVDEDSGLGSSLFLKKRNVSNSPRIKVKAIDFSNWIKQFKDDFVVVKMDTEGAEFPILTKMISDGTDKICDWLLVEFHPNKVPEYTSTNKNDLIAKLKVRGVNILEWH